MSLTKVSYSMINGIGVNVLDYGAVGDGSTDDTTAIQAAIDSTKSTGANYGQPICIPSTDPTKGYVISNLTLHAGAHIVGQGSHRTLLIRKTGSTGPAITDEGNPNKIILEGFSVLMNGTAGDAIDFLGDEANNVFGSEAWMNDIYVVRSSIETNYQTDNGYKVHFNASSMTNCRAYGFNIGFYIRGSVALCDDLISSNCVTNYKLVGIGHKVGNAYSESATNSHVQFGDGATSTNSCVINQLAAHLIGSATTPQIIYQVAGSTNSQLNSVKSGSVNFRTGSVLTYLITNQANGSNFNIPFQLTTNTNAGFFSWNADTRQNNRVTILGDANYDVQNFDPYEVYVFEGLTTQRSLYLPAVNFAYGRQIIVKNNDDASNVVVRPYVPDGTNIYDTTNTAVNNVVVSAGGALTLQCSNSGYWYVTSRI